MNARRGPALRSAKREGGFTLIELLVVITIIGILAALISSAVIGARKQAKKTAQMSEINSLKQAIGTYQSTFGDYPPSTLEGWGVKMNPTNNGIEALVACLTTSKKGGPYITSDQWRENRITNLDADDAGKNLTSWWFGDTQLREFTDQWGNPLVYYHHRDYKSPKGLTEDSLENGATETCTPQQSGSLKVFHSPESFMIWSRGPNGKNEDGSDEDEADDVHSW